MSAPVRERRVPAACRADVPLAPLTHCKIGGTARVLCEAGSEDDVAEAVEYRRRAGLTDDEVFVLGGGANVLINDVRDYGLVIKLSEHFNAIEVDEAAGTARIQAGIYTPRLVREAGRRGWEGFQFLAGVPGSLGGAVVMNAGVRELSTWDLVVAVEGITWNGDRVRVEREMVRPSYRRGDLPRDLIVTIVECKVRGGDAVAIHRKARELASSRKETQPLRWPSWGSTFKNPSGASSDGVTAGALIDSAGLKGFRVGDAAISEKHANFIVNPDGAAGAADVEWLIQHIQRMVYQMKGVVLITEVRIVGEPA